MSLIHNIFVFTYTVYECHKYMCFTNWCISYKNIFQTYMLDILTIVYDVKLDDRLFWYLDVELVDNHGLRSLVDKIYVKEICLAWFITNIPSILYMNDRRLCSGSFLDIFCRKSLEKLHSLSSLLLWSLNSIACYTTENCTFFFLYFVNAVLCV
jgi:hypothetical protein